MAMDIQALKSIQRTYTRQIKDMKELSYWDTLKKLLLHSQQRRRERYIITYTGKALKKMIPSPSNINEVDLQFNQRNGRLVCQKNTTITSTSEDQGFPLFQSALQWPNNPQLPTTKNSAGPH
ncbi:hypothetical protein Pcinc_009474 [Petrolisthes cinctipes]|uniref:Uncharacterized protein n=1 Tax=Petrolisthes cinctipes TaxID=88211 RepID=A0AAE1G6V7_PETCI|nr:hypothetical protein Pcinc_009474 [Petrolisthes cinctipes]